MSDTNIQFCLTFRRAYAKLRLQLDDDLGAYHGIDFDDFALLHSLSNAENNQAPLAVLAAELEISRPAMLRRLRPLEKTGLIALEGSVADRRVFLRPVGLGVVKVASDTVAGACTRTMASRPFADDARRLNETRDSSLPAL